MVNSLRQKELEQRELTSSLDNTNSILADLKLELENKERRKRDYDKKLDSFSDLLKEREQTLQSNLFALVQEEENLAKADRLIQEQNAKIQELSNKIRLLQSSKERLTEKLTLAESGNDRSKDDQIWKLQNQIRLLESQIGDIGYVPKRKVYCRDSFGFSGKPVFFFIVGAEGTGHHLMANLLDKFPGVSRFPRLIQQLFVEIWEPTIGENRSALARELLNRELKQFSEDIIANLTSRDWDVVNNTSTHWTIQARNFDMYSFPFDDPRNVMRRPDLRDILGLAEKYFEVRFLVMVRSELDSIVSLIRRNWWTHEMCVKGINIPAQRKDLWTTWPLGPCGYINVQARVVEDTLIYLNAQLSNLHKNYFRIINYHQLIDKSGEFVLPLLKFLGFSEYGNFPKEVEGRNLPIFGIDEAKKIVFRHMKKKTEDYSKTLDDEQMRTVQRIFHSYSSDQWPVLYDESLSLRYYESNDVLTPKEMDQTCYPKTDFWFSQEY